MSAYLRRIHPDTSITGSRSAGRLVWRRALDVIDHEHWNGRLLWLQLQSKLLLQRRKDLGRIIGRRCLSAGPDIAGRCVTERQRIPALQTRAVVYEPAGKTAQVELTVMSVPVTFVATFSAGVPRQLFKGRYLGQAITPGYEVTADGQKFLMVTAKERAPVKLTQMAQQTTSTSSATVTPTSAPHSPSTLKSSHSSRTGLVTGVVPDLR